jgi:hypothetical protein
VVVHVVATGSLAIPDLLSLLDFPRCRAMARASARDPMKLEGIFGRKGLQGLKLLATRLVSTEEKMKG